MKDEAAERPQPSTTHGNPEPSASLLATLLPVLAALWFLSFCFFFYSFELPNSAQQIHRMQLWMLLPQIVGETLAPQSTPERPSGWIYLLQRADLMAHAALILAAAFALGRLVLRGLNLLTACESPERWALAGGTGLSLLSLWGLCTGVCGMLGRPLYAVFYSALIVTETWYTFRTRRVAAPAESPPPANHRRLRGWPRERNRVLCWSAVVAPFVLLMFLGAMLPPTDFDVKEYHLQGPKEYYQNGRITFLPHNVYTSFPFLTEMLSLSGMVVRGDWLRGALVGKVVLMAFAPLTALGAFALGKRLAGSAAGGLAAAVYLSTPWVYRISIIAYTEGGLCCYVMLTILACHIMADKRSAPTTPAPPPGTLFASVRSGGWEFLTGLLAGSAAATKYPGLIFVTMPAALAVGVIRCRKSAAGGEQWVGWHTLWQPAAEGGKALIPFAAGVLLAFGPWLTKNVVETGNPVYPLAYSIFGGADWNEELNEKWRRGHSPPGDRFSNPSLLRERAVDVAARSDWQSPLLFGLAPCAFLVPATRRQEVRIVAAYVLFFFAGWYLLTHHIDRFWVPLIPAAAVLAGVGGSVLRDRLAAMARSLAPPVQVIPWGLGGACVCAGLGTLLFNWAFMTTPLCGYNAYLLEQQAAMRECTTHSMALLNRLIRPGERVLFVGEAEVFDARFPHRYHTVFDFSLLEQWCVDRARATTADRYPLRSAEEIRRQLHDEQVTHVFVNWIEILRYREPSSYGYTEFVSPRRLNQLVDMGVLRPVKLAPETSLRRWDDLSPARQEEVLRWGPELRRDVSGIGAVKIYDLYSVIPVSEGG